jgi:D-aspartate ligase
MITSSAASQVNAPAEEPTRRPQLDDSPLPVETSPVTFFDNFGSPTLAFALSLGRRGVPLHFYGDGAGRWSRYCSRRNVCPPVDDADRFIPWLRRRVQSGEIQRVAPTTDLLAYYISMLREDFQPEVRRTIPPLVEMERSLIKTRFSDVCMRSGQPVPSTDFPDEVERGAIAAERLGFPLMVKPKSHLVAGDERGRLVRDMDQFREAYRQYPVAQGHESLAERYPELRWPLLQKYIPSAQTRVFSISGYKDLHGGIIAASLSCKRRQWPPHTGISTAQVSWNDPRILTRGLQTVDKLVSCGLFELELLESGADLLAIDLNPRGFGFMGLDIALGNDLPWLWMQSTFRPLESKVYTDPRQILECRLPLPHLISRCVNAVFGIRSPRELEATYQEPKGKPILMLGDWHDPLPTLLANLKLLRHPGSLVKPYVHAAMVERQRLQMLAGST